MDIHRKVTSIKHVFNDTHQRLVYLLSLFEQLSCIIACLSKVRDISLVFLQELLILTCQKSSLLLLSLILFLNQLLVASAGLHVSLLLNDLGQASSDQFQVHILPINSECAIVSATEVILQVKLALLANNTLSQEFSCFESERLLYSVLRTDLRGFYRR